MTDTPPPESGGAAEPEVQKARTSLRQRFSIVWIIPVLALLISLGVVWQNYANQGRLIRVEFEDASGVRANETQLRYRNVVVGVVETVSFTDDLGRVLVEIRLDQEVGPYVDAGAQFWIVQPQVSAQGISGLDTVLGGVYIEGNWDGTVGEPQDRFVGGTSAPLVRYGQEGVTFRLRAASVEGLAEGTPILYRGITVGQVANLRLGEDGVSVVADAFVREPASRLINSATRFWDTSGFSFRFGASGAQLDVNSIASLVAGGVSFDTSVSGGEPIGDGAVFRLYGDEESARASVFANVDAGDPTNVTVIFEDSVPGLEVGAAVVFGGINVGRVGALTGILDQERFGDRQVRLLATLELQPAKIGLGADATEEDLLDFLQFAVRSGLRAQLQSASLLGGLQVGLVQLDDVEPATLDLEAEPYPLLPSVPAELTDFADTAEGVFNRVNNLPIEELLGSAIEVMNSVNALLNDDGVTDTPQEVLSLLSDVRGLINSEGVQNLPDQASDIMASLQGTADELGAVVTQLSEAGAVEALVAALDAAEEAANSVYVAVEEVPETLEEIDAAVAELETLIASVNDLPLASVVAEVEGSVAALRELLAAPATQGLTGDVSVLLGQVEGLVGDVREAGLVETANAALIDLQAVITDLSAELRPLLASARESVDATPAILANVEALTADLDALVRNVNALPLERVVEDLDGLLVSADNLIAQSSVQDVPAQVNATLADVRALLAEVTDSALVEQAVQTLSTTQASVSDLTARLRPVLDEAQRASASLADAAEGAPEFAARARSIADQIDALVSDANNLPLEELAARASTLLDSANRLVASPDTQAVPGVLADALAEVQRLLVEVQEGGLIENANATLSAAEEASQAFAQASNQLPDLVERMNTLLAETEGVISGYEASGQLGSEVRSALRDIRGAARSVDSLARQIERSPNSLLFGR